ncbi:hypothetical protein IGI04_006188 [Brassica rapa subsp. trilocularis]|uniref:DUF4005 domain-containing protein n=1 Tax=Brassica rapa subsp. trilocularis TaxID=1813537 RepID=A0ABQ7NG72_BRACM|nr:hypothetical protein IGI04_006188 [Brassica rapa subsp. trilocularis]
MIDSFESSDYTAKLWAQLQILPSSPSHQINPVRERTHPTFLFKGTSTPSEEDGLESTKTYPVASEPAKREGQWSTKSTKSHSDIGMTTCPSKSPRRKKNQKTPFV